jgi:acyl-CoA reductase-like NAD-dependent aldehyde dehydrogenase
MMAPMRPTAAPPRVTDPAIAPLLADDPLPMLVAGSWVTGDEGRAVTLVEPASGEALCRVATAGPAELERAVAAAERAFRDGRWSGLRPDERSLALLRWADLVERDADLLATLETLQAGKPIRESRGDVARALDGIRFYAAAARNIRGETIAVSGAHHTYTLREPVGVVAAVVPWNVPIVLTVSKAAPALAAGNVVIVKPSQATPLTALHLGRLWQEAGLPDGALSVLTGSGAEVGEALCLDPRVTGITFTGSTATGLRLGSLAALQAKRTMLELGGKSPNIVLADADPEAASDGAARAIFFGAGQICSAGSRLIVEAPLHDRVVEGVVERARALRVADPLEPGTDLGALISTGHRDGVLEAVARALDAGAVLAAGGVAVAVPGLPGGAFMAPTVLVDVAPGAPIACEEVFGPVLVVHHVADAEEAVRVANATRYGLAAGIWTSDLPLARRLARRLDAGVVWVNDFNRFDPAMPFGGVKASGTAHREWSHLALDAFLEHRSVWERQA